MKIIYAILAVVFALFAFVQYNDADWYVWMILYGYVSAMCIMAFLGKYNNIMLLTGIIVFLILIGFRFPSIITWIQSGDSIEAMSDDRPYVEETREGLGLMMGLAVMTFEYFRGRKLAKA